MNQLRAGPTATLPYKRFGRHYVQPGAHTMGGGTAKKNIDKTSRGKSTASWIDGTIRDLGYEQVKDVSSIVDFLELVLDNVYSGIIVCDRDCRIVFMNQVYAELLKTDRRKAVGKRIEEYFPRSRLSHVLASGEPELGRRCSLKTESVLLVNRIPLKSQGRVIGIILQTIFRDYKDFTDLAARLNLLEDQVKYQKRALDTVLSPRYTFESIIGESKAIEEAKRVSKRYARTDSPVLILGPTGTGKELFAHAVHSAGQRSAGPFVCLNCAGIPRELLESELFGYEPGAFTGARKAGKPGQIELAHRGTLYLDEIGELPVNAQAKLLRVLEQKLLDKVGGVKPVPVDFRLVAATNRDLHDMISKGEFRDDLYYRLNTMTVNIPPLSQRSEDIPILIRHFLSSASRSDVQVTEEAQGILKAYSWPGNVRELKNVIDRALSLTESDIIEVMHLPRELLGLTYRIDQLSGSPDSLLADELARCEKNVLTRALAHTGGNMSKAAKMLGISRSTLYEKCKRHGVASS